MRAQRDAQPLRARRLLGDRSGEDTRLVGIFARLAALRQLRGALRRAIRVATRGTTGPRPFGAYGAAGGIFFFFSVLTNATGLQTVSTNY